MKGYEKKRRIVLKIQTFQKYSDKKFKKDLIEYIHYVLTSKKQKECIESIIKYILWLFDHYFDNISSNLENIIEYIDNNAEFHDIFTDKNIVYIETYISYKVLNFKNYFNKSLNILDFIQTIFIDCMCDEKYKIIPDNIQYPNIFKFFYTYIWRNINIVTIIFQIVIVLDSISNHQLKNIIFKYKKHNNMESSSLFSKEYLKVASYIFFKLFIKHFHEYQISRINTFLQNEKDSIKKMSLQLKHHPKFLKFCISYFLEGYDNLINNDNDDISIRFKKICNIKKIKQLYVSKTKKYINICNAMYVRFLLGNTITKFESLIKDICKK